MQNGYIKHNQNDSVQKIKEDIMTSIEWGVVFVLMAFLTILNILIIIRLMKKIENKIKESRL